MFNVPFGHIAAQSQPRALTNAAVSRSTEKLRRVGYADGERQPRTPSHWANRR